MRIAVSACLLGVACRYDSRSKPHSGVLRMIEGHDVLPICPEVAGGLSIPHPACEIVSGHNPDAGEGRLAVTDAEGIDQTEAFSRGAQVTLDAVREFEAELAILKAKSPSCGTGLVYDGTFTGTLREGWGVAARALHAAGIPCIDEEQAEAAFPHASSIGG